MPSVQGSSRISDISAISPLTGPTGAGGGDGPTGPTGATGTQGRVGFTGFGIISAATGAYGTGGTDNGLGYELIFNVADWIGGITGTVGNRSDDFVGATMGVTGIRGGTGDRVSDFFIIENVVEGPNYGELFKTRVGMTAYFRTLTVSGRDISVSENDYEITLHGSTWGYGRMGNTGELLFINEDLDGLSAQGALNTYWSGDQLTARILTHKEHWNVSGDSNNNLPDWGADPTNTSAVVSASGITGESVTFSSIALVDSILGGPIGATAIASGIHLGGGADGEIYRFQGNTYSAKYAIEDHTVGSCCYCKDGTGQNSLDHKDCVDYVTKSYCDAVGGIFSTSVCLYRSEGPNCYSEGACCVNTDKSGNTRCVSTSEERCQTFGGFFIPGLECTGQDSVDSLGGCPDSCGTRGSCCINNVCYKLTEYECSFSSNSTWLDKPCEETNCCLEANRGACCVDEACFHTDAITCSTLISASGQGQSRGVFWGVNSKCAGLNMIPEFPDYTYDSYLPNNCIVAGVEYGCAENGICVSCTTGDPILDPDTGQQTIPPCGGCDGWHQVMPTAPPEACQGSLDDSCACVNQNEYDCACEPFGADPYTCVDSDSCGTIILADGRCWECCRNQPGVHEPTWACCVDSNGDGDFDCIPLTESQCDDMNGVFANGRSCEVLNCNAGACCEESGGCIPNTTPETCTDDYFGVWIGGDCTGSPCASVRMLDDGAVEGQIPPSIIPTKNTRSKRNSRISNLNKTRLNTSEGRKLLAKSNANKECVGSSSLSSCIEPGIVLFSDDNDFVVIETGIGECSCCCPGVCWKGALGDDGIVGDCRDIDAKCYPVFDSSGCYYGSGGIDLVSLPDNKPICDKEYLWETNSLGCTPYIDNIDSNNPVWMVCSCCCGGTCKEYSEPISVSECENRGENCVGVNGCDNCLV